MLNKVLLLVTVTLSSFLSFSQNIQKELENLSGHYKAKSFTLDIKMELSSSELPLKVNETLHQEIRKTGYNYYNKTGETITILTYDYKFLKSKERKAIVIEKNELHKIPTDYLSVNLDSAFMIYEHDSLKQLKPIFSLKTTDDDIRVLSIKPAELLKKHAPVEETQIFYHADYTIQKVVAIYKTYPDKGVSGKGILTSYYSNQTFDKPVASKYFDITPYISITEEQAILKQPYLEYQLFNNLGFKYSTENEK